MAVRILLLGVALLFLLQTSYVFGLPTEVVDLPIKLDEYGCYLEAFSPLSQRKQHPNIKDPATYIHKGCPVQPINWCFWWTLIFVPCCMPYGVQA